MVLAQTVNVLSGLYPWRWPIALLLGMVTASQASATTPGRQLTILQAPLIHDRTTNSHASLDARSQRIVEAAQNSQLLPEVRAVAAVWSILRGYYPREISKVRIVVFEPNNPGLSITALGTGPAVQGKLTVGAYFLIHLTSHSFARRVLQVGHELRHVDQWRQGMVGSQWMHEREFLAFNWEAITVEFPGTGRVAPDLRIKLINAALEHLNAVRLTDSHKYPQAQLFLQALRKRYASETSH